MWDKIASHIAEVTGETFKLDRHRSIGGGCINQGYRLDSQEHHYFVKLNRASLVEMFAAEALGLEQIWKTQTIRVPKPICTGTVENHAYIVLEWLDLGGASTTGVWQDMGRKLAEMHRTGVADKFGWERSNTIGSTPQMNAWTDDWAEFWVEQRIRYQLQLAQRRGGYFPEADELLAKIPEILAGHQPQPSLVHGDLWGGNASVTPSGEPVIFDPATYYGDREVDLAMTELFGGFPPAFYQGYQATWPLEPGYEHRKILYNLYHILNHFNLFGGGYAGQAKHIIQKLLNL
ncbi:fructosamine kinase family protein [Planktothricoides raciborskii]|uniref:Fructosamine kinase family protein n=1 Tax=Planktothricoides raciborskii FACHB-1370 TaxID=2949576 RepID=A0ABR8EB39_9CYAN|nr:fructosamine kinase family protein [Planktothricoides raciborskii]MBD2543963.1 fructosamine kinase family protein [Planktothricoides raciborskii FACHB-1370]MBD2582951.1 fructosamine kinase family protein [Planktothricoides raciborskii FACHB-1261]